MNELLLSSQHGSVLKLVFKTANELKRDLYTSRINLTMLKIVLIKENLRRWEEKKKSSCYWFPFEYHQDQKSKLASQSYQYLFLSTTKLPRPPIELASHFNLRYNRSQITEMSILEMCFTRLLPHSSRRWNQKWITFHTAFLLPCVIPLHYLISVSGIKKKNNARESILIFQKKN